MFSAKRTDNGEIVCGNYAQVHTNGKISHRIFSPYVEGESTPEWWEVEPDTVTKDGDDI